MRSGADARLPNDAASGSVRHTAYAVYTEMLIQICRDYPGLPDPRTLTIDEVVFFYSGLRRELREHTRPKPKSKVR